MITAIEGRPGMGKSVYMVAEITRYVFSDYYVVTNIDVHFPDKFKGAMRSIKQIQSLDDLLQLNIKELYNTRNWRGRHYRGIKVVLDEVQTYLNSRNWDKLDIRFQLLLQQHRKRGIDIIGATQSIKRADVVFRELVQVFYRIRKIVVFKLPFTRYYFGFFYLREYDPDTMESSGDKHKQHAIGWPFLFLADPYIFRLYDTTQEYKPESREGQRVIEEYIIVKQPPIEVKQLVKKEVLEIAASAPVEVLAPVDKPTPIP